MLFRNKLIIVIIILILAAGGWYLWDFNPERGGEALDKIWKIGILVASDAQAEEVQGFKGRMQELGFEENKNIEYFYENPKGDRELTKTLARGLIEKRLDFYVSFGTTATKNIQDASVGSPVKIIFGSVGNHAELGLESLHNPGKNITGVASGNVELSGKRLELLKEIVPGIKKIGVVLNINSISYSKFKILNEEAAKKLGIELILVEGGTKEEILDGIKTKIRRGRVDGFLTTSDTTISGQAKEIVAHLTAEKIPSVDLGLERGVKIGYLAALGGNNREMGRQTGDLLAKAIQGTSLDEIPVEFPEKLELHINASLAKEIGIEIPRSVLLRADYIRTD